MKPDRALGLGDALAVSAEAHRHQVDKAGEPYFLHVVRVVLACPPGDARVVAALHDVVEDTDHTLAGLRALGFSQVVCDAVGALTHAPGEGYDAYLDRVLDNALAMIVKRADLADNLDRNRIPHPTQRDLERWAKYESAVIRIDNARRGATEHPAESES